MLPPSPAAITVPSASEGRLLPAGPGCGGAARYTRVRRIGVFGRLSWLHRQQDVFRGTPVLVGGGDWIYLTPGVGILVGKRVNVQAEIELPVYRSLSNRQPIHEHFSVRYQPGVLSAPASPHRPGSTARQPLRV